MDAQIKNTSLAANGRAEALKARVRDRERHVVVDMDEATLQRIRQRWKAASYTTGRGQDWEQFFASNDKDGNGKLDVDEFVLLFRRRLKIPTQEMETASIRLLFAAMDANGDGGLDWKEVHDLLTSDLVRWTP